MMDEIKGGIKCTTIENIPAKGVGCEILFVLLSCQSLICLSCDSKKSEFSDMAKYKQNRNETTERE